ncbi:hypothetical protein IWX47DRAFT_841132 [Phyllosticta citricarpa]
MSCLQLGEKTSKKLTTPKTTLQTRQCHQSFAGSPRKDAETIIHNVPPGGANYRAHILPARTESTSYHHFGSCQPNAAGLEHDRLPTLLHEARSKVHYTLKSVKAVDTLLYKPEKRSPPCHSPMNLIVTGNLHVLLVFRGHNFYTTQPQRQIFSRDSKSNLTTVPNDYKTLATDQSTMPSSKRPLVDYESSEDEHRSKKPKIKQETSLQVASKA